MKKHFFSVFSQYRKHLESFDHATDEVTIILPSFYAAWCNGLMLHDVMHSGCMTEGINASWHNSFMQCIHVAWCNAFKLHDAAHSYCMTLNNALTLYNIIIKMTQHYTQFNQLKPCDFLHWSHVKYWWISVKWIYAASLSLY